MNLFLYRLFAYIIAVLETKYQAPDMSDICVSRQCLQYLRYLNIYINFLFCPLSAEGAFGSIPINLTHALLIDLGVPLLSIRALEAV